MALKDCVISIKNQNFNNFDVWIIDNNSIDGTIEYLKTLSKPFNWISEPDKGIYDAMNKGTLLAKGEWLYFLGANDKLFNENVLKSIFFSQYKSTIKIIIGKIKYQSKHLENKSIFTSVWSNKIWIKNCVHHQSAFYHYSLFKTNVFSSSYKILGDYALNLKFYKNNVKALQIPTIVAFCDPFGKSKEYSWPQYKEELDFKTKQSSIFLKPIFYILILIKFLSK